MINSVWYWIKFHIHLPLTSETEQEINKEFTVVKKGFLAFQSEILEVSGQTRGGETNPHGQ